MGIFGALTTCVCGPARAVLCAGKHLRQHRQLADHRVQADRHQLPSISFPDTGVNNQLAGSVTTRIA